MFHLCSPHPVDEKLSVTTQVDRLKAEGSELSRKARIKPFKTFSLSTTFGSIREDSSLDK
jgi:hypothetical protein